VPGSAEIGPARRSQTSKDDIIDPPTSAAVIGAQVPFAWAACFTGGRAFLFTSHQRFSATVDVFLADRRN
jgi:hypothetical protein